MWLFGRKRADNVPLTSMDRLEALERRVKKHDTEILDCLTALDALRDKVLRKIQYRQTQREPEMTETEEGKLIPV